MKKIIIISVIILIIIVGGTNLEILLPSGVAPTRKTKKGMQKLNEIFNLK